MSRYPAYTPQGIDIREAGPGESGKVVETITADDLLALKRLVSQPTRAGSIEPRGVLTPVVKSAAATPEPGLDVDAELERLRGFHQSAINEDPRIPKSTFSHFNATFRAGFRVYLRDLESRCKPAEPSGWPDVVVTEDDALSIDARTAKLRDVDPPPDFFVSFRQALQEWLDSKPRPKPAVAAPPLSPASFWQLDEEQIGTLLDAWNHSEGDETEAVNAAIGKLGFRLVPKDAKPIAAGTPESVELTDEQSQRLAHAYDTCPGDHETEAFNAALRSMGLGLHRLDPKPSAVDGNLRRVELIMDRLDYAAFRIEMERRKTGLASILPDGEGNLEGRIVAECIRGLHDFLDYDPAATPDPLSGDPKPSAEPDPGDTATPTEADSQEVWQRDILAKADRLDMLRSEVDVQLLILRRDLKALGDKVAAKLDAIAGRLDGPKSEVDVQLLILRRDLKALGDKVAAKLDAIAGRLDGPKSEAATIDNEEAFALVKYVYLRCPESQSAQAFVLSLANLGLMLARIPFSEGDPS